MWDMAAMKDLIGVEDDEEEEDEYREGDEEAAR